MDEIFRLGVLAIACLGGDLLLLVGGLIIVAFAVAGIIAILSSGGA